MIGSESPALLHRICPHCCCTAGLAPSLIGNAVSWGLYWVAWKSINGYYCTQQGTEELTWNMKLVTGMQAGTPTKRGIHALQKCPSVSEQKIAGTASHCHVAAPTAVFFIHIIAIQACTCILL